MTTSLWNYFPETTERDSKIVCSSICWGKNNYIYRVVPLTKYI